jgi:queuine/archaeosine tRNA-ribosyltransferase
VPRKTVRDVIRLTHVESVVLNTIKNVCEVVHLTNLIRDSIGEENKKNFWLLYRVIYSAGFVEVDPR